MPAMRPNRRSPLEARLLGWLVAPAVAIALVGVAILPFLTPAWVSFEQGRAEAAAWTGYDAATLRTVTDSILHDLVLGPPAFDVRADGTAVLKPAEQQHMRDVRGVFGAFAAVVAVAIAVLALAGVLVRRQEDPGLRRGAWRGVRRGAAGLAVAITIAGAVAFVAFDAAFAVFHELFFAPGSYTFDPRVDRLVQLFPDAFWSETSIAVGVVILALAVAAFVIAGRRLRGTTDSAGAVEHRVPRAPADLERATRPGTGAPS